MVRMADLLKKAKGKITTSKDKPKSPSDVRILPGEKPPLLREQFLRQERAPLPQEKLPQAPLHPEEQKKSQKETVSFSEMFLKEKKGPSVENVDFVQALMQNSLEAEEEAKKLYYDALEFTKKTFTIYKETNTINHGEVNSFCQKIVNTLLVGAGTLLKLFHELDSEEFFLYHNAVNVSILSVELGMVFKYNKTALQDLALVGLLHDIELIKHEDVIKTARKLSAEEMAKIREHSLNAATFLDRAANFKDEMVTAILQHHERKSGQGYPEGLLASEIKEMASIVGIVDTYEAMIHFRPYKSKVPSSTAVLNIINNGKDLFPNAVIKALVSCVGVYPIGSIVELNTGEIGKVLDTNFDFPLRPVINVVVDKDLKKLEQAKTVNLLHSPSLYIKKVVEHISL